MLLVVDAGNTNIVFAVHDGTSWRGIWRISTDIQRTSDEYAVWLLTLLGKSGLSAEQIDRAVIGTVVPAALYHLRRLSREWLQTEPLIAALGLDWGFKVHMDQPGEVGVDRLLNGLAAHRLYGGPAIIIDFGTATTFDVVDAEGGYNGGAIAPGVNLSIEALHQAAARLPRIAIGRPRTVIGRGTIPAMRSGIFWGYIGLVEGIVARIRAEVGGPMKVIATGGLAPLLAEGTDIIERIDPELTLEGLRILAGRNPHPLLSNDKTKAIEGD